MMMEDDGKAVAAEDLDPAAEWLEEAIEGIQRMHQDENYRREIATQLF